MSDMPERIYAKDCVHKPSWTDYRVNGSFAYLRLEAHITAIRRKDEEIRNLRAALEDARAGQ
jgi:hypothetical protein